MTRNDLRTLLNIALPLAQPLVGAMASVFGIGHTQAEMSARSQTPVVPQGYAFSIWGLLFALSIAWGIWQLLPSGRDSPVARRLGWPLAATFAGSILWMVLSQLTENGWHLVAVMLLVLAASLTAFFANRRAGQGPAATPVERWLVRPLVGLLAGWVSVATFANIAGAAVISGFFPNQGAGLTVAAVLILLACGGLVLTVLWVARGSPWYAAAVAWALVAILYANTAGRDFNPGVAVTAGALLAVVLAMAWQRAKLPAQAQFR